MLLNFLDDSNQYKRLIEIFFILKHNQIFINILSYCATLSYLLPRLTRLVNLGVKNK